MCTRLPSVQSYGLFVMKALTDHGVIEAVEVSDFPVALDEVLDVDVGDLDRHRPVETASV